MWGREMRAGLVFVVVALLVGGAFREWRRSHQERFAYIVEELEAREAGRRDAERRAAPSDSNPPREASEAEGSEPRLNRAELRAREAPVGRIDPNRASARELERLPGIGPFLAGRIVLDRERNGRFESARDLLRVPGIGPRILDRIAPHLAIPSTASGDSSGNF